MTSKVCLYSESFSMVIKMRHKKHLPQVYRPWEYSYRGSLQEECSITVCLLLLYSSALHQHTDDNVPGTDITMPCVASLIYICSQIYTRDKISEVNTFFFLLLYTIHFRLKLYTSVVFRC